MCFKCKGESMSSSASKPSNPLFFVATGMSCHAENCSIITQVNQPVEKPHVGETLACRRRAASKTCGHVSRVAPASPASRNLSRLTHMTADDELNGNDIISPVDVE